MSPAEFVDDVPERGAGDAPEPGPGGVPARGAEDAASRGTGGGPSGGGLGGASGGGGEPRVSEEEVWEALKAVTDPEIGIDVVNLGLVYGVEVSDGRVRVRMTLTSLGCPATGLMEFMTREAVGTVEGVEEVEVEWTFDPPWTPDRMTEEGREMMQALGFW